MHPLIDVTVGEKSVHLSVCVARHTQIPRCHDSARWWVRLLAKPLAGAQSPAKQVFPGFGQGRPLIRFAPFCAPSRRLAIHLNNKALATGRASQCEPARAERRRVPGVWNADRGAQQVTANLASDILDAIRDLMHLRVGFCQWTRHEADSGSSSAFNQVVSPRGLEPSLRGRSVLDEIESKPNLAHASESG